MNKLNGNISISRVSGAEDFISIRLEEELSGITFTEIRLSFEAFAKAITGQSGIKGELTFNNILNVGKTLETKEEICEIFYPKGCEYGDKRIETTKEALKVYEIDGWAASLTDALNHHRRVNYTDVAEGTVYRVKVSFKRYV